MEVAGENIRTLSMDHHGLVAMLLNGLGFTNRRLYLTSQFFESKPTEVLLGEDIKASDIF